MGAWTVDQPVHPAITNQRSASHATVMVGELTGSDLYSSPNCTGRPADDLIDGYLSKVATALCFAPLLPAEPVELPVTDATQERMPLIRCKPENRPIRLTAVANTNLAIGQAGYLDTVAVGETKGTLHPVTRGRNSVHVCLPR